MCQTPDEGMNDCWMLEEENDARLLTEGFMMRRIHEVLDVEAKQMGVVEWRCLGSLGRYLHVRKGATQGRGAGGREANSPPLLLERPGQLFKLHLLLPDRLQQSCCILTLLHTHYTAPWGEKGGIIHSHTDLKHTTA